MVKVSQHAAKRFIQRHEKRPTAWVKSDEMREARQILKTWYDLSLPFDKDKRIYGEYVLVVLDNTIITIMKKPFERKLYEHNR